MDYEQFSKFLSGELPPEEKESLMVSLETNEDMREEAAQLKNSWAAAQLTDIPGDEEIARRGWEMFISKTNKPKKIMMWSSWRIAAAAAVAAILVIASYFAGYSTHDKISVTAYHTLIVPTGQTVQLTLSDGSEIWLNSRSKLIYPEKFTSKRREIQLEGEGLFKVASNKKKPFVVKTGLVNVVATGTQFNVSAYPNDNWIATTLIEGSVKVQTDANRGGYELKSGQIATFNIQEQRMSVKNTDPDMQISWIHGEYRFKDMALEDLTKRLERYFNRTIVFEDETLKQQKFTGTFYNSQSIENILRVIETSTNMQYRINDTVIYIK